MKGQRRSARAGGARTARRGLSEREAIAMLERLYASGQRQAHVEVGIGDDAAVLRCRQQRLVWTTDVCVEGVHFERRWLSLADVGWRAVEGSLSDLAAMGAKPLAILSSLIFPASFSAEDLFELGAGQAAAAQSTGCPIVGGNVSRGSELSITISALGETPHVLLRSGASPGEELWLIGDVGLAAAGLALLRQGVGQKAPTRRAEGGKVRRLSAAERRCTEAWKRPVALVSRGRGLLGRATAAIDISDGLAGDAGRLAEASGVRAVIEERALRRVLRSELVQVCGRLDGPPIEVALEGGEDYALLAAGPERRRPSWARRIGRIERGRLAVLEREGGESVVLSHGFDHFQK